MGTAEPAKIMHLEPTAPPLAYLLEAALRTEAETKAVARWQRASLEVFHLKLGRRYEPARDNVTLAERLVPAFTKKKKKESLHTLLRPLAV